MSILEKFNDREITALERATAKLREKQPVKKLSGIPGIHWNAKRRTWTVYCKINGAKRYVGVTTTLEGAKQLHADYNAEQAETKKTTTSWKL